jgi:hypothetical protein
MVLCCLGRDTRGCDILRRVLDVVVLVEVGRKSVLGMNCCFGLGQPLVSSQSESYDVISPKAIIAIFTMGRICSSIQL